jgi:hypothetical protein
MFLSKIVRKFINKRCLKANLRFCVDDPETSGKWKPFSRTRNAFPEIMKNVSRQAHALAGFGPSTASVRSSYHMRNTLRSFSGVYKTITIDYITYGLGIGETNFTIPYFWYITKGLRPDCVFYLDKVEMYTAVYRLTDIHVCGIRMPEWPNINYNESSSEYE